MKKIDFVTTIIIPIAMAIIFLVLFYGVGHTKIDEHWCKILGWEESSAYKYCQSRHNHKSEIYTDGIFDCEDWARIFNAWYRDEYKAVKISTLGALWIINGERKGHALSIIEYERSSNGQLLYFIVDPRVNRGLFFDRFEDLEEVSRILVSHYIYLDKTIIFDHFTCVLLEDHGLK